jgi:NitT/TauT family transport system ATP-binding protein
LEIKKVSRQFSLGTHRVDALRDFSCSVREGEFISLVGPSGCGKTTLLKIVAGLLQPSSGHVVKRGNEIVGPGADRGMVFQSYTSFPWLTVRKNIEFGLSLRNLPSAERRRISDRLLTAMGLVEFENAYPETLSGGMQQRIALARTIANDPEILLMDEPFGALDSQTRWDMQELLMRVWEFGRKTVLFVTHDVEEALFLADRVLVMTARPGRVRDEFAVPYAYPRAADIKTDPAFAGMKKSIIDLLREETSRRHETLGSLP